MATEGDVRDWIVCKREAARLTDYITAEVAVNEACFRNGGLMFN